MEKKISVYPLSRKAAQEYDEYNEWENSFRENRACAKAIEKSIKENYSENKLNADCAKSVIENFGFDRVNWVLANTVRYGEHDGRYSRENKEWAKSFEIPKEENNLHCQFAVNAHPGLVDIFVNLARKEWQKLGLYEDKHCYAEDMEYTGKVLVLNAKVLQDEYKTPDNQLFYASGGNGCKAESLGTKVFGRHLNDGEETYYRRSDFIGVMKLDLIPEWAQKRYAEFTDNRVEQTEQEQIDTGMGGIS